MGGTALPPKANTGQVWGPRLPGAPRHGGTGSAGHMKGPWARAQRPHSALSGLVAPSHHRSVSVFAFETAAIRPATPTPRTAAIVSSKDVREDARWAEQDRGARGGARVAEPV